MSIKLKVINSGKWLTVSTVVQTLIQFVQVAILARLMDPEVFGVIAISNIVLAFFAIFADLGFTNSIIHKQESNPKILSTVYYLNIFLGIILFAVIQLAASSLVAFYNEPKLTRVLQGSSVIFLFVYFGSVQFALLKKELQFKFVAFVDIIGNVAGFAVTIFLAYQGLQEMALVYGGLVLHFSRTMLEVYFGRKLFKPLRYFRLNEVTDHLKFGIYNMGENLLGFIRSNWDSIIIGKIVGTKYLGIYTLAMQLAVYPVIKLNPMILQVVYPVVAKLQHDDGMLKRTYLKILDTLSYLIFPLLAGLFITVDSVVPLFYGPGWEQTFPLIRIFVFVAALNCLAHPLFTVAYSKGKPSYLFYLSIINFLVKTPIVYFMGKYFGIIGVAYAILIAGSIDLVLNFITVGHLIGDFFKPFIKEMVQLLLFCVIMVGAVQLYKLFVGYSGWMNTLLEIGIGGIVFIGLTMKFKYSMADLKSLKKAL